MNCPECKGDLVEYEPGSNRWHCKNDKCRFVYRDADRKVEYLKPGDKESIFETERRY